MRTLRSLSLFFLNFFLAWFLLFGHVVEARRTRLTWVNGIAYGRHHMDEGKVKIEKIFGGKRVEYCHNPTAMSHDDDTLGYIGDLTQAGTQKLGRITEEVDQLVRHLKEAIAAVGRRGRVIHIAHSQGALITHLATKQLSSLEMSQIEVIAFGGAAALRKTPQTPFHRCVNYYSVNDPLLFLVPTAAQALRSGFVANDEFCFLSPKVGDPIEDHNLLGPTYADALIWEGYRFQNMYQGVVYRKMRSFCLILIALAEALMRQLRVLLRAIAQRTVVPLMRLLLCIHAWVQSRCKDTAKAIYALVIAPTIVLANLLLEYFGETLRSLSGEQKYEPVSIIVDQARTRE